MSSEPIPFHHIIPRKLMMNTKNFNTKDLRRATYPFLRRSNTARKENQTVNELEERTELIHFFLSPTKPHLFPYLQNQLISTHFSFLTHGQGGQNENIHLFKDKYPHLLPAPRRETAGASLSTTLLLLPVSALSDFSTSKEGVWCDISAKLVILKEML